MGRFAAQSRCISGAPDKDFGGLVRSTPTPSVRRTDRVQADCLFMGGRLVRHCVFVADEGDVFARYIVGWRVSSSMQTDFVPGALEQALYARQPWRHGGLTHHSDRGSQYVSIRYSERLAEADIEPSVGSTGDSYDNALAETINGLYKAEIIHRRGPWKTRGAVELATLEWVSWFNNHRLLEPIGYIPPAEAEANCWQQHAKAVSSTTTPEHVAAQQEVEP